MNGVTKRELSLFKVQIWIILKQNFSDISKDERQ